MGLGPGDVVAARFEIERATHAGGMADLWQARDRETGEAVAIKTLSVRTGVAAERFRREAHALSAVEHPGVVGYVGHGTEDDFGWLAMEWLEGEDLAARLEREPLTIDESTALLGRTASVLGDLHARGIVHRDVKPSNLFLRDGDLARPCLVDLGIARLAGAAGQVTRTGVVVGTPGYLAPEQARGDRDVDARADVFALGCVLYECLCHRPAFEGTRPLALLAKVLFSAAPRAREALPEISPGLDELIARMLSIPRDDRPPDGHAVSEALELVEAGYQAAVSSRPPSALGGGEQQLLSVVVAGGTRGVNAATLAPDEVATIRSELRTVAELHGARLEPVADGSVVLTLISASGAATDQMARGARCALAVERALDSTPVALATGRGLITGRLPVGDVIDTAVTLIDRPGSGVRVDEVTAHLLETQFRIGRVGDAWTLGSERENVQVARTLLGRPSPCVGRSMELAMLRAVGEQAAEESTAGAVLLTGAPGIGKSRIRHEFVESWTAEHGEGHVWLARGDPMRAGSPLGLAAQALSGASGLREGDPLEARREALRSFVAERIASGWTDRVTDFIGELVGVPFDDTASVQLRVARQDPLVMGDQMRRAFENLLAAQCKRGPLLVVLEDLHWGDMPTVRFVDAALRNLKDQPWLVLAVARPEVHDKFPDLWASRGLQEVRVGGLSRKAGHKLVRNMLGEDAREETVRRIVEHADGNALFLEELIRAEAEGGEGRGVPRTVLAMMQARLEAVEPEARRLLRAASVFGQVFWRGGLAALLGGDADRVDVDRWLGIWLKRELVHERPHARFPGERELAFRHSLMREAAYSTLTESDRRIGHHLAGEWLEKVGEGDATLLAEHYEQGGARELAAPWWRKAAEEALEGNDLDGVHAHADRAVSCGAEGELLGRVRLLQSEAFRWQGENENAEQAGNEAMALLPMGSGAWCRAAAETAGAHARTSEPTRLDALADELLAVPDDVREADTFPTALARVANYLRYAGRVEKAIALGEAAETAGGSDEAPRTRAWLCMLRAVDGLFRGDLGAYIDQVHAARTAFHEAGEARRAANEAVNIGFALSELGAWKEAEHSLREGMDAAVHLGLTDLIAVASQNLGRALGGLGELVEGIKFAQASAEAFASRGDPRMEGGSRIYMASMLLELGEVEAAEREARRAVEALGRVATLAPWAKGQLAAVLLSRGNADEGLARAREGMEMLSEVGQLEAGESLLRLTFAEALRATGADGEARDALADARERLLARADKIGDRALRASFLSRVPENQRTLELSEPAEHTAG